MKSLPSLPRKQPNHIIVRFPNWIGDLVMATPILEDLRHRFPKAMITAMCQNSVAPLLLRDPHIDEIFAYQKPNGWIHRSHHLAIIDKLKRGTYDLGILLTNSFSSAWWFWQGNVEERIGFATHWRSFLLNQPVPLPDNIEDQHQVYTYKALLSPLGIPVSTTAPKLYLDEEENKAAEALLKQTGLGSNISLATNEGSEAASPPLLVGINPGAAYGSAKCWLPERFREVTELLLKDDRIRVLYFGSDATSSLVHQICQGLGERVINLSGKTSLRELMALIRQCTVLLTNDSGPMHIADALGVPIVALFGSTSAIKTGPFSGGTIIHKQVACSPCYKRTCPIDFPCMKNIAVAEVYHAIKRHLVS